MTSQDQEAVPGTMPDRLRIYLTGVLMGAADTIPGVSGGTMALIAGIYTRLVAAIDGLLLLVHALVPVIRTRDIDGAATELRDADVPFLVILGAGIVTAVVALAGIMHAALVAAPAPMNALFLGLIGGSTVIIGRDTDIASRRPALAAATGALLAFLVTGVSGGAGFGHALPVIFLSGVVASAAMLLPGISGAAFLYILGQYAYLTGALSRTVGALPSGPALATDGPVVAVFVAGAAVGLLSISRVVSTALERHPAVTMAFLVGLMAGALRLPVTNILDAGPWGPVTGTVVVGAVLAGTVAVLGIDRLAPDRDL